MIEDRDERLRNGRRTHDDISLYIVLNLPPLKFLSTQHIFLIPLSIKAATVDNPPGPEPMTIDSYDSIPITVNDQDKEER